MKIEVEENLCIELINEGHSKLIFDLVDQNRTHLRKWFPFVDNMQTVEFAQNFVKDTMHKSNEGIEYAFVIISKNKIVGRIGVYKIDNKNRIGEIGYWIAESSQGKGIITKSCSAIIEFCFKQLNLNRIEIKCGTENTRSKSIPEKLNFFNEGIIRKGELLHGQFIDLNLFSLLKSS